MSEKTEDDIRFEQHLKRCGEEVATWPEWKRNLLGSRWRQNRTIPMPEPKMPEAALRPTWQVWRHTTGEWVGKYYWTPEECIKVFRFIYPGIIQRSYWIARAVMAPDSPMNYPIYRVTATGIEEVER